ncbi:GcvT family protein [Rhodovibrionaceae bacterium A322]
MKTHAKVVVIGGGVVGCSALYHLAKMGCTDTLLIELDELTSGSTWHAAGNVPTYSTSWNIIKFQRYTTQLYSRLAEEVDYPINYHVTGSLRLAHSEERMQEYHHVLSMARAQGLDYELLTPDEARARYNGHLELHDIKGALWDPYDGDIDPSQVTQALAKGSRDLGAEIARFTRVTAIEKLPSGEWLVITDKGNVICETVINAGGYRGAEVAAMVGQYLPIVSMQHQYLVTESVPELAGKSDILPLMRDPDVSYYLRQERDGLILGPYEWQATPHWEDGKIPHDFANQLYADDLDRLEHYIADAMERVPILGTAGVQRVVNGPIPYSPDGYPYIGKAYGVENFFHCCSFSFGICQGGGAGKSIAEYVLYGEPEWDLWAFDPRRYSGYANQKYVVEKATELYQNEYAIAFPHEERPAGRPAKMSPLYSKLQAKGALFGARGGWERATLFPRNESEAKAPLTFGHPDWFPAVAAECEAVRERVGLLDLPGFAKFELKGKGAADWLDSMIAGPVPKVGRISLSYFCSEHGGILCEMTLTRLAEDHFWLITASAAEWHDWQWLEEHMPKDGSLTLSNLTGRYGTLVLAGPRARDVLSQITSAGLTNADFPWLTCQTITIGYAEVLAMRVNYVGELGWELHIPVENMVGIYDALWAAGEAHGIADFGLYAMDSLRLEKCYRSWKVDMTTEYSPLTASLDRFVRLDKPAFIGRDALLKEKQEGSAERFVPLLVDSPDFDTPACAAVFHEGEEVGLVTSGGYGHTLQSSIALAYVRTDLAEEGQALEVEILGQKYPAKVASEPLYDPKNEKLRA